jgi:(R,R)-butanediol dehydrogenase/meso-butanediol dehydrogenase/diacetyl reductase
MVTGICGTDLHEYIAGPIVTPVTPHVYTGVTNPQILGHEFSAVVADKGSAVANVKVGDRVSIQPLISPRDDYYGRRGLYHLSPKMGCVGLSWGWGGMGELAIVNDYNVAVLPKGVSDIQGAMIEPAAVAVYAVDRGNVRSGFGRWSHRCADFAGCQSCRCWADFRQRAQCFPPQDGERAGAICHCH